MSGGRKGEAGPQPPKFFTPIEDWTCHVAGHQVDGRCCWDRSLIHLVYDAQGGRALYRFSPETRQWYRQTNRGPKKQIKGGQPGVAAELDRKSQENAKLLAEVHRLKREKEALTRGQSQPSGEAWTPNLRSYPSHRNVDPS